LCRMDSRLHGNDNVLDYKAYYSPVQNRGLSAH